MLADAALTDEFSAVGLAQGFQTRQAEFQVIRYLALLNTRQRRPNIDESFAVDKLHIEEHIIPVLAPAVDFRGRKCPFQGLVDKIERLCLGQFYSLAILDTKPQLGVPNNVRCLGV